LIKAIIPVNGGGAANCGAVIAPGPQPGVNFEKSTTGGNLILGAKFGICTVLVKGAYCVVGGLKPGGITGPIAVAGGVNAPGNLIPGAATRGVAIRGVAIVGRRKLIICFF
jgi:hypothetical protein